MKILSVGSLSGVSNTCLHRHWALKQIADYVDEVNTNKKPCSLWFKMAYHLFVWGLSVKLPENNNENKQIIELVNKNNYDIIWIDKGLTVYPETLCYIKKKLPNTKIISYSPDNMALRHNQSYQYLKCLPYYDFVVTNKSYIIEDIKKMGAKNVIFVNNSFESSFHYPRDLNSDDYIRLGADVGFVGTWEKERCESILYLVDHGIQVRVFGDKKWQKYKYYSPNLIIESHGLFDEDYAKSFKAFKISLCFLRKMNFDQQTTRTVEIPACGGFMIAERTMEHQAMFEEDKEAVFFSTNEELLEKCKYYLTHDSERNNIISAGYNRCIRNYSNYSTLKLIFRQILTWKK